MVIIFARIFHQFWFAFGIPDHAKMMLILKENQHFGKYGPRAISIFLFDFGTDFVISFDAHWHTLTIAFSMSIFY